MQIIAQTIEGFLFDCAGQAQKRRAFAAPVSDELLPFG